MQNKTKIGMKSKESQTWTVLECQELCAQVGPSDIQICDQGIFIETYSGIELKEVVVVDQKETEFNGVQISEFEDQEGLFLPLQSMSFYTIYTRMYASIPLPLVSKHLELFIDNYVDNPIDELCNALREVKNEKSRLNPYKSKTVGLSLYMKAEEKKINELLLILVDYNVINLDINFLSMDCKEQTEFQKEMCSVLTKGFQMWTCLNEIRLGVTDDFSKSVKLSFLNSLKINSVIDFLAGKIEMSDITQTTEDELQIYMEQ